MCGLAGCSGSLLALHETVFKNLLLFSQVRGPDSTGVGGVRRDNGEFVVHKSPDTATDYLLYDSRTDKLFQKTYSVLIGHCRAATIGAVNKRNAHPFIVDHLLGAHNGTMGYITKGNNTKIKSTDTDSEGIYAAFSSLGVEEAVKGFSDSQDAYALTWYDSDANTINLLRNSQRPLFYGFTEDYKVLFWASEAPLLFAAISRNNIKLSKEGILELPTDTHTSWVIPAVGSKFDAPTIKPCKAERPAATGHFGRYNYAKGVWENKEATGGSVVPFKTTTEASGSKELTALGFTYSDPRNPGKKYYAEWREGEPAKSPFSVLTVSGSSSQRPPPPDPPEGSIRLYWNQTTGSRLQLTKFGLYMSTVWVSVANQWETRINTTPPSYIPFPQLDVNARHEFAHRRYRMNGHRHKEVFYKGFGGKLLSRREFEEATSIGCSVCGRVADWGNRVFFYDNDHHYLCEYCSAHPDNKILIKPIKAATT